MGTARIEESVASTVVRQSKVYLRRIECIEPQRESIIIDLANVGLQRYLVSLCLHVQRDEHNRDNHGLVVQSSK